MSLVIHAPNVHRGGGKALLLPLLEAAVKQQSSAALLDHRMEVPQELRRVIAITWVAPTILGRLAGEWTLRRLVQDSDTVLCFGNLPPLFKIRGRVVVFVQNRYLVDRCRLDGFPRRVKLRLMVERLWLRLCRAHAHSFIVQTGSMQRALERVLGRTVEVMALLPDFSGYHSRNSEAEPHGTRTYDFLYAATGEPHKNHVNLLEAWKLLASEGLYPSLCLTISETDYPDLFRMIEQAKVDHRLNILNVPATSRSDMEKLYTQAQALVYPSLLESFGLPLIEANRAGLCIVAAELDYVRDLVNPNETFDPRSPQSISRAVKRFLKVPEEAPRILTSDEFLNRLLNGITVPCES